MLTLAGRSRRRIRAIFLSMKKLAEALLPDDPTLAREVSEAAQDARGYVARHRDELRDWGVSAKSKAFLVTALLAGLARRKTLAQVDWKEGAADAHAQVKGLLRAFEPAAKRPKIAKMNCELDEAVARWDEQLAAVGLVILQLDNGGDQTWLFVAPTEHRELILRAAKGIDGLTITASTAPAKKGKPVLKRRAVVVKSKPLPVRVKAASAKDVKRARTNLAWAKKVLARRGGWFESAHFGAACAWITLGKPARAKEHVEALLSLYKKKRSIEISLRTIPHLAAAALVDRKAVASWAKRITAPPAYESLAAAVPKAFGGAPVGAFRAGRSGNERAYGKVFSALGAGKRARLLAALEEFDDFNYAGGHRNPIINAVVAVSGLDLATLPPSIIDRMWPGFPPMV
jgi:hypothetical protein